MKETGSIKRKLELLDDDGVAIDLLDISIFITVARGNNIIKSFGSASWNESEYDELLIVDTAENFMLIFLTGDEIDAAKNGKYDINIWWYEEDADFESGYRRFFTESKNAITISDD